MLVITVSDFYRAVSGTEGQSFNNSWIYGGYSVGGNEEVWDAIIIIVPDRQL